MVALLGPPNFSQGKNLMTAMAAKARPAMFELMQNSAGVPLRGEEARLIPVVSDGSRESRATSIFLAVRGKRE